MHPSRRKAAQKGLASAVPGRCWLSTTGIPLNPHLPSVHTQTRRCQRRPRLRPGGSGAQALPGQKVGEQPSGELGRVSPFVPPPRASCGSSQGHSAVGVTCERCPWSVLGQPGPGRGTAWAGAAARAPGRCSSSSSAGAACAELHKPPCRGSLLPKPTAAQGVPLPGRRPQAALLSPDSHSPCTGAAGAAWPVLDRHQSRQLHPPSHPSSLTQLRLQPEPPGHSMDRRALSPRDARGQKAKLLPEDPAPSLQSSLTSITSSS